MEYRHSHLLILFIASLSVLLCFQNTLVESQYYNDEPYDDDNGGHDNFEDDEDDFEELIIEERLNDDDGHMYNVIPNLEPFRVDILWRYYEQKENDPTKTTTKTRSSEHPRNGSVGIPYVKILMDTSLPPSPTSIEKRKVLHEQQVPRFFSSYSKQRLHYEIEYLVRESRGSVWSQRVILEMFYYAVMYGTDHKPNDLQYKNQLYYPSHKQKKKEEGNPCTSSSLPATTRINNDHDDDGNGVYDEEEGGLATALHWLDEAYDVCEWEGITCGSDPGEFEVKIDPDSEYEYIPPPDDAITKIDLMEFKLSGTLPRQLYMLKHLHRLNLNDNDLKGTIPDSYGWFENLQFIDLGVNQLTGEIPYELANLQWTLEELWLERNQLVGTIPSELALLTHMEYFDISGNKITGQLPTEFGNLRNLGSLFLENNLVTGTVMTEIGKLQEMKSLDIGHNQFSGSIPTELGLCQTLADLHLVANRFTGTVPTDIFLLTNLQGLIISENEFTGPLPEIPGSSTTMSAGERNPRGSGWFNFRQLLALSFDRNKFTGTLPIDLFRGLSRTLVTLDMGFNQLTGTLPVELGWMSHLERITAPGNQFSGTLPFEMERLTDLIQINLTSNNLTGTVPKRLCIELDGESLLMQQFGCDAILCPPGTYHPEGAASVHGGCRPCKGSRSKQLGKTKCGNDGFFLVGDIDGDGVVSPREVLRLLFVETDGEHWGDKFKSWFDLRVHQCDLPGVTCVGTDVSKIDLTDAALCTDGRGGGGDPDNCPGLPAELGNLSTLEVLLIKDRHHLQGTIPSELGKLSRLKYLDLSQCRKLSGTIPSEIGQLSALRFLNLSGGSFNGTIPDSLYSLQGLEKLWLSQNEFTGTISTRIGLLTNVREVMMSRAKFEGTIPSEIGILALLENLELYTNQLRGTIPPTMVLCRNVKRIDMFNNYLSGTIPDIMGSFGELQILHLKKNRFTGTLPAFLGQLVNIAWLDLSSNRFEGTVPESFAYLRSLKDLRLGSNKLFDPIPQALCSQIRVNSGPAKAYGCDAILCPLGTYSDSGYATDEDGCTPCPPGETTLYLGSPSCIEFTVEDLISMFYEVMKGSDDDSPFDYDSESRRDAESSACVWEGITCDDEGHILSISFPTFDKQ